MLLREHLRVRINTGRGCVAAAVVLVLMATSPLGLANDSIASFGMGGLVLEETDAIAMRKEDLFVSPSRILVAYEFVNETQESIEAIVAFPIPEYHVNTRFGTYYPLKGFSLTVDGAYVAYETEERAFLDGQEYTALLNEMGITIRDFGKGGQRGRDRSTEIDRLPEEDRNRLKDIGLVVELDDGRLTPKWTVRMKHYWRQSFPAGEVVEVKHAYEPVIGGGPSSIGFIRRYSSKEWTDRQREAYEEWVKAQEPWGVYIRQWTLPSPRNEFDFTVFEHRIDYILKTGADWRGPIRDFRLTIEKPPGQLWWTSFGDKPDSETAHFVHFIKKDFEPKEDLVVEYFEAPTPEYVNIVYRGKMK